MTVWHLHVHPIFRIHTNNGRDNIMWCEEALSSRAKHSQFLISFWVSLNVSFKRSIRVCTSQANIPLVRYHEQKALPAMQWHAHKRLFAFLSGNLVPLFLRLQYVLNVFIFRSFVKSLSMPIDSLLTTIFFLETKSLPSIPTKRYESEPDLPKPKLLLPNASRSNRHCLSIEKTSNRQRRGKLTMSSRLAGWSPRLC